MVKKGDRIRLVSMGADDPMPMEPGATGTVRYVTEWGDGSQHLSMEWDPGVGRSLNLVVPPDVVEVMT